MDWMDFIHEFTVPWIEFRKTGSEIVSWGSREIVGLTFLACAYFRSAGNRRVALEPERWHSEQALEFAM